MNIDTDARPFGFPTGAIKNTSPAEALRFYHKEGFTCPEIHPCDPDDPLIPTGRELFANASIHLPSRPDTPENKALLVAGAAASHGYERLIVHPYVIRDPAHWRYLGPRLIVENMDFRSPGFMTADDMESVFSALPEARFCLDLAHTYGWCADEADRLLHRLADRLAAVHYSEIHRVSGDHFSTVSEAALMSHAARLKRIPQEIPIVFETGPSDPGDLLMLRQRVVDSLNNHPRLTDTNVCNTIIPSARANFVQAAN